jgi:hypothetical protein
MFAAGVLMGMNPEVKAQQLEELSVENCTDSIQNHGKFVYHRFLDRKNKCWMSVLPFTGPMFYRSFLMTSEGLLMVFNSIDYDTYGVSDGARSFMLFPRNQDLGFEVTESGVYVATSTKGVKLIFDLVEQKLAGMIGGIVKEDLKVYPGNRGGVEFSDVKALVLDGGWRAEGDPFSLGNRESTFIDILGKTCKVQNRELFTYTSDGNSKFRFSDPQLKIFLSRRCPNLKIHF